MAYLQAQQAGERYLVATTNANSAAPIILATGEPVMALGGFLGSDPILTADELMDKVRAGEVRFFLLGGGPGGFGGRGGQGATSPAAWVPSTCAQVPASEIGDGVGQLYDCGARGVLYGIAQHNHSPVIFDPFDQSLDNANLVVFAKSGAGKSYFTKLMALRNLLAGVDFLVIDPEDEYRALCTAVDGQQIRLASSSGQHLNPFDLPPATGDEEEGRDPLAEQVAALLGLLEILLAGPGATLTTGERAILDAALYETYRRAGISADTATHGRRAPLLRDLHLTLERTSFESARDLAVRLRRYVEGSLAGLFAGPTNVALDRRFVVFNVQAIEPELRPLGIHLIAGFVWNQVRRHRRPRLLIIDEAWSLLQYPEGGAFLAGLARRARKYYLGLVTITQDVADFLGVDQGRTVLTNAACKLLMKQDSTTIEPVAAAFQLSPEERQYLLGGARAKACSSPGGATSR